MNCRLPGHRGGGREPGADVGSLGEDEARERGMGQEEYGALLGIVLVLPRVSAAPLALSSPSPRQCGPMSCEALRVCQTRLSLDLGLQTSHLLGLGMHIFVKVRRVQDSCEVAEAGQEGLQG